jgi:tetratricopeptide (TPR) repeat protein
MPAPLIGSVLLIAGAEAAVFYHTNALQAWTLDEDEQLLACHQQARLFQDSPAEKRILHNVRDMAQVKRELLIWVKWQRTLHFLISGMDAQLRDSTRTMALALAEEYLADAAAAQMATARLFGCPLPQNADLAGAQRLANAPGTAFVRCMRVYLELEQTHTAIASVKSVLEGLAAHYATPEHDAEQIYIALVDNGVAAAAARAVAQHDHKAVEELLWQFGNNRALLENCPQLKKMLGNVCQQLLATLLPPRSRSNPTAGLMVMQERAAYEVEPIRLDPFVAALHTELEKTRSGKKSPHPSGVKGKAAADKQKQFILEAHGKGQAGKVQQLVVELIHNQLQAGKATHLCKSLCALGAEFTQRHDEALALRVYEVAKLADPNDAVSYAGFAETLRSMGKLGDALTAYGEAKTRFPNDTVCHNGYAETMRSMGKLEDALTAYGNAKTRFPNDDVCHNGYAETLRSMGKLEDALTAYGDAKTRFPNNDVCHAGYAETLRSLGKLEGALTAYGDAKTRFPNNDVCHNGYAETLRSMGQAQLAMAEYRQLLVRFPNNRVVRNALTCLLIEQGDFSEAEKIITPANENKTAAQDWHDIHVLAMLRLKQGDFTSAEKILRDGATNALLPATRTVFQHTLSCLFLRQKNYAQAEQTLRPDTARIIEFPLHRVLRAHAMAGLNQLTQAREYLSQIDSSEAQIIELKQFITLRYGLQGQTKPDPTVEQALYDAEFSYLLRAA